MINKQKSSIVEEEDIMTQADKNRPLYIKNVFEKIILDYDKMIHSTFNELKMNLVILLIKQMWII